MVGPVTFSIVMSQVSYWNRSKQGRHSLPPGVRGLWGKGKRKRKRKITRAFKEATLSDLFPPLALPQVSSASRKPNMYSLMDKSHPEARVLATQSPQEGPTPRTVLGSKPLTHELLGTFQNQPIAGRLWVISLFICKREYTQGFLD